MNSLAGTRLAGSASELIRYILSNGGSIAVIGDELRCKAPRGVIAGEELRALKTMKNAIVALLQDSSAKIELNQVNTGGRDTFSPPSFTQISHWNSLPRRNRAVRTVASITRISRHLDDSALKESVCHVIARHDALRTRIVTRGDVLMQCIGSLPNFEFEFKDFSAVPSASVAFRVDSEMASLMQMPIDISRGPLIGIRVVRLRGDRHVLMVALEHSIADAQSAYIFLSEILTTHAELQAGRSPDLPAVVLQFPEFAMFQASQHEKWLNAHAAYWQTRLSGAMRVEFPYACACTGVEGNGWDSVSVMISEQVRGAMAEWCRERGTTLVIGVLSAYLLLISRWCEVEDLVIGYQVDGRVHENTRNCIGYFASTLYLRLNLRKCECFGDVVEDVIAEYCAASEHYDMSYVESSHSADGFVRNTCFNWVPGASRQYCSDCDAPEVIDACRQTSFVDAWKETLQWDREPFIVLQDFPKAIAGALYFPKWKFSMTTMELFCENFTKFLTDLIVSPTLEDVWISM